MSDTAPVRVGTAVAATARTVIQGGPSWVIIEFIEAFDIYDFTERQYGIAVVVLTAIIAFVQNAVENKFGYALFRKFSYTNPPILQKPDTPLSDGTTDALPEPVLDAEVKRGNT